MKNIFGATLVMAILILSGCSQSPSPTSIDPSKSDKSLNKSTVDALVTDPGLVPNSYIVILSSKLQNDPVVAQMQLDAAVRDFMTRYELTVTQHYTSCLLGFAATMRSETAAQIGKDPRVEFVEQDRYVEAYSQTTPTGITRIGGTTSSTQSGNGNGTVSGVDIYIIDTGIQTNHPDLNVVGGINYATGGNSSAYNDQNGHGTHVAGTAAAKDNTSYVVGVAPGANLYAVRVLDRNGSGQFSWVLSGVNWVTARKNATPSRPMVANMSLGAQTGLSMNSLDIGVQNSINAGVTYCIAAGNSSADAINFSPAHVPQAITVGAYSAVSSSYGGINQFASFSNYGSVVDILAPGVNILSTYKGTSTATMSGTSMSTPHVTGTVALYLSTHGATAPSTVVTDLVNNATSAHTNGVNPLITAVPGSTTNLSVWAGYF